MAHDPHILDWISKYGIKSILNAPGGDHTEEQVFLNAGAEKVLSIDLNGVCAVTADLCVWKPDGGWDAVYINCIFCTAVLGIGDPAILAKNYASWPVKHILLYDTPGFDWEPYFLEAGWRKLEDEDDGQGHRSRIQLWGK